MKKTFAAIAFLPLSACISFGAKPPPSLLTLTSAQVLPVGQTQSSANAATITIAVPSFAQFLATTRVPVQSTATSIAYVQNAQWSEVPARLFARLMSDTIAAKTGRVVLTPAQSFSDPGARLSGELRNFGVDARTNEAVVTFDGALIRSTGTVVEKRRFETRVPLTVVEPVPVGEAINQAANQVAGDVAEWVGR